MKINMTNREVLITIFRLLLFFGLLILLLTSCKSTTKVVTRDRFISDTLITHTTRSVLLPTKNVTIIDSPCVNDSLKPLDQIISTPYANVSVKEKEGNLVVEVNTDSIVNERVREEIKRLEKDVSTSKEVIVKYRLPPWMWYVVGYAVLLTLYTFRRFIPYLNLIP